jgi:lysophospholipase L1-like esterase
LLALSATLLVSVVRAQTPAARFEKEILAFEEADRTTPPPADAALFVGSSTFRLWTTLSKDMPDIPVINRGFGGSEISDSIHYFDRIVKPYRPRIIVVYAGTNDINSGKSPERVRDDFRTFVDLSRQAYPGVPIVFLAIKPTPARWSQQAKIDQANRLVFDYCRRGSDLHFIDTARVLLGPNGLPKESLVVGDKLHFNTEGYRVWANYLRPRILKIYREASPQTNVSRLLWRDP